ncbi:MAG: hypothetical protein KHZ62_11800 [Clostridiales bacterium]|nr:hypothetical protein [Clostridiales bacterium]
MVLLAIGRTGVYNRSYDKKKRFQKGRGYVSTAWIVVSVVGILCLISAVIFKIMVERFLTGYGLEGKKLWGKVLPLYFLVLTMAVIGTILFLLS